MKKIIFSLTAHANVECLYDLIDNIKKCFIHYDIMIFLSLTENIYNIFDNKYYFVKIITKRSDDLPMWGHCNLFHHHMLNVEYIYENNITYDFFWFVASNEMFVKIVSPNFLDEHSFKIISEKDPMNDIDYDIYYNDFIKTEQQWMWFEYYTKDTYFMNYLYSNKLKVYTGQHEGLVLPSNIMSEILDEYNKNKLYENSTFKGYVMEEIFIHTYILNKYNINYIPIFCFRFIYSLGIDAKYEEIEAIISDSTLSIKPVQRDYNDCVRTLIRNKLT
jgi:hypothetical protein